jgi:hypothetical protein
VVFEGWGELCEDDKCQIARPRYILDLLLCGKVCTLRLLDFDDEYWKTLGQLCSECTEYAVEDVCLDGEVSEEIWRSLPSFFNLPSWDLLKNHL